MQTKSYLTILFFLILSIGSAVADEGDGHSHSNDCEHHLNPAANVEIVGSVFNSPCFGEKQILLRSPLGATDPSVSLADDKKICTCIETNKNAMTGAFIEARDSIINADGFSSNLAKEVQKLHLTVGSGALKRGNALHLSLLTEGPSQDIKTIEDMLAPSQEHSNEMKALNSKAQAIPQGHHKALFGDNEGQNCFSFREYFKFSQLPQDNSFFTTLAQVPEYNRESASHWNYHSIRQQLSDLTSDRVHTLRQLNAVPEEDPIVNQQDRLTIYSLVARMKFLNANPLFKNLFLVDSSNNSKIYEKQQALYKQMQTHFRPKNLRNCHLVPGKCRKELAEGDGFNNFLAAARKTVADDDVLKAIKIKGEDEVRDFMARQAAANIQVGGSSPDNLKIALNFDQYSCDQRGYKPEDCVPLWGKYCGGLTNVSLQPNQKEENFLNSIDFELSDMYESDPSKNLGYKEAVDLVCNSKLGNPPQNFNEYKATTCRGSSANKSPCTDRALLLAKFLDGRDTSADNSGNLYQALTLNALSSFLKKVPVESLSEELNQRLATSSTRTQSRRDISFNMPSVGSVDSNVATGTFAEARASSVSTTASIRPQSSAVSHTNSLSSAPDASFSPSSQFLPSVGSFNAASTSPAVQQVQREIDAAKSESTEINREIRERESELRNTVQANPSDESIKRLEQELKSLKEESANKDSRFFELTKKLEKLIAQEPASVKPAQARVNNNEEEFDAPEAARSNSRSQAISRSQIPVNVPTTNQAASAAQSSPANSLANNSIGGGATLGNSSSSVVRNSVLMEANAQKNNSGASLIIQDRGPTAASTTVPVDADTFELVRQNPQAVRTYVDPNFAKNAGDAKSMDIVVEVPGDKEKTFSMVAIQESGSWNFYTPEQAKRKIGNRSIASVPEPVAPQRDKIRENLVRDIMSLNAFR